MKTDELESLRQQSLMLAARVGALETISRILFALICSYDASPEMREKLTQGVFPMMLKNATGKRTPENPETLQNWLADQELQILRREFDEILSAIDEIRQKQKRTIN